MDGVGIEDNISSPGLSGSGAHTTAISKEHCLTPTHSNGGLTVVSRSTKTDICIGTDICLGTDNWLPTFSPELCLELLPGLSEAQVNREIEYNRILGIDIGVRPNIKNAKRPPFLQRKLEGDLRSTQLLSRYDTSKYETLITNFSGLLASAEKTLEEYKAVTTKTPDSYTTCCSHLTETSDPEREQLVTSTPLPDLPPPVRSLSVLFDRVSVTDICKDAKFRKIGMRSVDYFGSKDYRYGATVHRAKDYPANETIDQIITEISHKLDDPTFNKENVTCLVTKYDNGKCHIPFHSDDETCIVGDIVTVSLGAERDLIFRSKTGKPTQKTHKLQHGEVYIMTRESQNFWEHGIPPDSSVTQCRVSLTFRRLKQTSQSRPAIPRIQESTRPATDPTPLTQERILFLTDSMLRDVPNDKFPGHMHVVKKEMYQLQDFMNYEQYFEGTKYVIISSGINDLSRYNHRHYSLVQSFKRNLDIFCVKYPNTTFIFNSLLLTKFEWLNKEVYNFNRDMFDYSVSQKNFWFFDSHHVCSKLSSWGNGILDPAGNGIHLLQLPKREITLCLIVCIGELAGRRTSIRKYWPLRREFVASLGRR